MADIYLGRDLYALVDDEDYQYLKQFSWYSVRIKNKIYAQRRKGQTHILMHTEITGFKITDHKDGNGLNNKRTNLREATYKQNAQNKAKSFGKSSIYKGVTKCTRTGRWRAYINNDGKFRSLGTYDTQKLAAEAYDVAAKEAYGEYAYLNLGGDQNSETLM